MSLRPLAETLLQVIEAIRPPRDSGLVITEAEIELPLELWAVAQGRTLLIAGSAPHSRFKSGVLPQVHLSRMRLELLEPDERPGSERGQ
jgi:hypothetical protein